MVLVPLWELLVKPFFKSKGLGILTKKMNCHRGYFREIFLEGF